MKIDSYYQRQKCSPVSGKIRFMREGLCAYSWGFAEEGASNECRVIENDEFLFIRSLYFPNFHMLGHNK